MSFITNANAESIHHQPVSADKGRMLATIKKEKPSLVDWAGGPPCRSAKTKTDGRTS